jgi:hypothetical protein
LPTHGRGRRSDHVGGFDGTAGEVVLQQTVPELVGAAVGTQHFSPVRVV